MNIPWPIERVAQTAVTGEFSPRRHRLLADSVRSGPHQWVVDLGSGDGPLLEYLRPQRYTGIDGSRESIDRANEKRAGSHAEFLHGDITTYPFDRLAGADCVVVSSVTHHLSDAEVRGLLDRIWREIAPDVVWVQDAEPTGVLGPLVRKLDRGDHLRPEATLVALLRPFSPTREWEYVNPVRSFRQFLLRLSPPGSGPGTTDASELLQPL